MTKRPDLELKREIPGTERAWTIQRIGWVAMLLLIISALAGFFGTGPVDRRHVRSDAIELAYSRFQRMTTTSALEITVPATETDVTRIWMDRNYLRHFEISSVNPQPESATSSKDRVLYAFRSLAGQPFAVTFYLRAAESTFGRLSGSVGVEGRGHADISQFIWP